MFTLDEMLSKRNQREALLHFKEKKDSCGPDGMRISELNEFWELNAESILEQLRDGTYEPGIVKYVEIVN